MFLWMQKSPRLLKQDYTLSSKLLSQILAERWNPSCPHSPPQLMAGGCFADTELNWGTRQKRYGLKVTFSIVPQTPEEKTPLETGNEHHRVATQAKKLSKIVLPSVFHLLSK